MDIITNNVPRQLIHGYELTDKEREVFDYLSSDELFERDFFRYKGSLYDMGEIMRITDNMRLHNPELNNWHGYESDSYFSGIVVKYLDREESVIVGTYIS